MAAATAPLLPITRDEFHARYSGVKPAFEFWFGEAIQKSVPTVKQAVTQAVVSAHLLEAGYKAGSEVELRIDPDWEPVPDIAAVEQQWHGAYPTKPVDLVIEILSADDKANRTLRKCREYARIGIEHIFVLDPDDQVAWRWDGRALRLEIIPQLTLPNGRIIDLANLWQRVAENC